MVLQSAAEGKAHDPAHRAGHGRGHAHLRDDDEPAARRWHALGEPAALAERSSARLAGAPHGPAATARSPSLAALLTTFAHDGRQRGQWQSDERAPAGDASLTGGTLTSGGARRLAPSNSPPILSPPAIYAAAAASSSTATAASTSASV